MPAQILKSKFQTKLLILAIITFLILPDNRLVAENIYKRFTATQCDSLIKANETNPNFVILDVRTPGEWNSYHIMGSINRSTGLSDFTAQLDALPKHKTFLLHCQSGGRSAGAFQKMKDLQFAEVYEMIGGMNYWNSAGLPITTITQPKLMLVDYYSVSGNDADTLKVTVTNRANGILSFTDAAIDDLHAITNNFNSSEEVQGAFDYTFSIVHSMHFSGKDSTQIVLNSNGGELDFTVVSNDGIIEGLDEKQIKELVIYPNPADDKLFIKTSEHIDEISVLNINGQMVLNKTGFESLRGINISTLNNGIYVLLLKSDENTTIKKFIVKH